MINFEVLTNDICKKFKVDHDLDSALLKVKEQITRTAWKSTCYWTISRALAEKGDFENATKVACMMEKDDLPLKDSAFVSICQNMAMKGLATEIEEIAKNIFDEFFKKLALEYKEMALKCVKTIRPPRITYS